MIYIYDNSISNSTIDNISLSMNFQHKIDTENIFVYPEKYNVLNLFFYL